MQFSIFATIGAALLTYPANVYAQETTLSSSLPTTTATDTYTTTTTQGLDCNTLSEYIITATGTCTTITTQGVNCPTLSTCIVPDCLKIVLVTRKGTSPYRKGLESRSPLLIRQKKVEDGRPPEIFSGHQL